MSASKQKISVATIHAFIDDATGARGNPAGVNVSTASLFMPKATMQAIAAEMGHAETAFLATIAPNRYKLRWFMPTQEVNLCGHATLAAAHYLHQQNLIDPDYPIEFSTKSGTIRATVKNDHISIDLRATPGADVPPTDELTACLDVPVTRWHRNGTSTVAEVADMDALAQCRPNLAAIAKIGGEDLIVTCKGAAPADYAYRCFAPQVGLGEDPVTGSANCTLAPYWAAELGKQNFHAVQASPEGGVLHVTLDGARVHLAGESRTLPRQIYFDPATLGKGRSAA